jgi:hypothetical protein
MTLHMRLFRNGVWHGNTQVSCFTWNNWYTTWSSIRELSSRGLSIFSVPLNAHMYWYKMTQQLIPLCVCLSQICLGQLRQIWILFMKWTSHYLYWVMYFVDLMQKSLHTIIATASCCPSWTVIAPSSCCPSDHSPDWPPARLVHNGPPLENICMEIPLPSCSTYTMWRVSAFGAQKHIALCLHHNTETQ